MPYSKDMNKQPDLNAIMASYTERYNAERRRSLAAQAEVAGSTEILTPESDFPSWGASMGQWARWNISDRH